MTAPATAATPAFPVILFQHVEVGGALLGALGSRGFRSEQEIADCIRLWLTSDPKRRPAEAPGGAIDTLLAGLDGRKFTPALLQRVAHVFLYLTAGVYAQVKGGFWEPIVENGIKRGLQCYLDALPGGPGRFTVLSVADLEPVLGWAQQAAGNPELTPFLLGHNRGSGYDTPKLAAAILRLARLDRARDEMIAQIDHDVRPTVAGLTALAERYAAIQRGSPDRLWFCMSWHYRGPAAGCGSDAERHLLNAYSIRTGNFLEPRVRWDLRAEAGGAAAGETFHPTPPLPERPPRLNVAQAETFVRLCEQGRWGSNLRDPISGAAMTYPPDVVELLPPFVNVEEKVIWIDDYCRWLMLRTFAARGTWADAQGLPEDACGRPPLWLEPAADASPGILSGRRDASARAPHAPTDTAFEQDRHARGLSVEEARKYIVNDYLVRLIKGCILACAIAPEEFVQDLPPDVQGFGRLMREPDHLGARRLWEGGLRRRLLALCREHARKVLLDWHAVFCRRGTHAADRGYFSDAEARASLVPGFAPTAADTTFNAPVVQLLLALDRDAKDNPVEAVFQGVLDRYLRFRYAFWPHVVSTIAAMRAHRDATAGPHPLTPFLGGIDSPTTPLDAPAAPVEHVALALIERADAGGERELLVQWHARWERMLPVGGKVCNRENWDNEFLTDDDDREIFNLYSAQQPDGEPARDACLREVMEEVFEGKARGVALARALHKKPGALPFPEIASVGAVGTGPLEHVHVSRRELQHAIADAQPAAPGSTTLKRYILHVFRIELTEAGVQRVKSAPTGPKGGPLEWVRASDILAGWTPLGRPIDPAFQRTFREATAVASHD